MFKLNLDLLLITNNKLTINEYLALFKLYLTNSSKKHSLFTQNFTIYDLVYKSLIEKELIISSLFDSSGYALSDKATKLFFNPSDELFNEFYAIYPTKVSTGLQGFRSVSNKDVNTSGANKTKSTWKTITLGNIELQKKIIACLKVELNNRELSGSLAYLPNIDNWLIGKNWEKWEDLPDSEKKSKTNVRKL
jgi:predicted aspartyl protease